MLKSLVLTLLIFFSLVCNQFTLTEISYDQIKDVTTVRLPSTELSGEKDRYHSLSFSIYYSYPGRTPAALPERVNFELISVVKARRLNPDLYVVFLADGKPIHFSSNRSAIRNPVRGRPWIGEKIVFLIPREEFLKLAAAKKLAIKMGDVTFDFDDESQAGVRELAKVLVG
jgi:hypothetical protein